MKTSVYFPASFSASRIAVVMELLSDSWQIRTHLATYNTQARLFFFFFFFFTSRAESSLGDNSPKNTHGVAAAQILTGPTTSAASVRAGCLQRHSSGRGKCTPAPQAFLLSEVLILLTLKSLICKNSSMIDLHFLSISSSDSEGFSWAGAGGASGLAGRNIRKKKKQHRFGKGKSASFSEKRRHQSKVCSLLHHRARVTSSLAPLPPVWTPNISVNQPSHRNAAGNGTACNTSKALDRH